ncbi:unnamed protein product [Nippostrongylus brasiliensis]|uniref:CABIT domain-containing protein n=1 Tax=Nippostrongylus brasiliensis TaxID=27835 RepID=A0A0N4YRB2_NIPBR|nr:unnamed protein product [Nippostrongylus brasiliensis]
MSTIELEKHLGDPLDVFDLAKDQKRCRSGRHSKNGLLLQKLSDRAVVFKTLHDPADTLSKREKKRLQKASSSSSLDLDVQYSLNKQQRWKTINVQSLLDSHYDFEPEALVVNGVITPSYLNDHQSLEVKDVFAKDGDVITKISSKGKGHRLRHFEMALRKRSEIDKDKVQPARILYNVVAPSPASTVPSSFTLGDYVVGASATSKTQRCARRITLLVQDEERKKKISGIKSPSHSISPYYSSSSLFEVIEINAKLLGGMGFHDAIASLEHERLTIKVRINTNIRYKAPMDSEALIFMVKRQRDFVSLFNSIVDFIRGLRERNLVIPMKETRFTKSPKDFHDDVNSRKLAVEQVRVLKV